MAVCKGQGFHRFSAEGQKQLLGCPVWDPAFAGVMAFPSGLPASTCGWTTACIFERGIHLQWKDLQFGIHHILWEAVPMVNAFTAQLLQFPEGVWILSWQPACLAQCCCIAFCLLRQKSCYKGTKWPAWGHAGCLGEPGTWTCSLQTRVQEWVLWSICLFIHQQPADLDSFLDDICLAVLPSAAGRSRRIWEMALASYQAEAVGCSPANSRDGISWKRWPCHPPLHGAAGGSGSHAALQSPHSVGALASRAAFGRWMLAAKSVWEPLTLRGWKGTLALTLLPPSS